MAKKPVEPKDSTPTPKRKPNGADNEAKAAVSPSSHKASAVTKTARQSPTGTQAKGTASSPVTKKTAARKSTKPTASSRRSSSPTKAPPSVQTPDETATQLSQRTQATAPPAVQTLQERAPVSISPTGPALEQPPAESVAESLSAPNEPPLEPEPGTMPSVTKPQAPDPMPEPADVEPPLVAEVEYAPPPPSPDPARPSLFIVHITPELATVAKVGGLADVVFGLSRELAIRGNHVEIILPKYASMRYDHVYELHEVYKDLWVPWYDGAIHCTVFFGFVHGRKCFFIEPHSQDNFFNRHSIYGFRDDVLRYAFFSRAAVEFLWKAGKHPDVIHCHDWQTALVPVFLYEIYQRLGMTHPRICLTIHNFAHQGVTGGEVLRATGLHHSERYLSHERLGDHRYPNALNLLKGGIVYSNFVTTVSPRYAFETKDQGQGFGLEPTLHAHQIKYGGVVNGVDYDVWNPDIDHHIPVQYGVDSIDRKYDNKRALRHRLMLADNEKAIVAFIGRLDPQKGLELVRHAIFYTLERGAQFVLLGSSPDDRINADFWGLKQMLNDSPDCHLEIGFDEDLSHLIYAGADMMLVPSQFEPCGLTQLIALRYGTIPVVRAVGGLADTVFDKDHSQRPLDERNGYVFNDYDNAGLESALGRAIDCYNDFPEHFRDLIRNAMRSDYSWNRPGQDYLNIYDYIRDS